MTMDLENLYWRTDPTWSHRDEDGHLVINDDAPERAKRSYAMYAGEIPSNPAI